MPSRHTLPRLRTHGVIAQELGESLQRVQYVLRTRHHIKPTALAGFDLMTSSLWRWYATRSTQSTPGASYISKSPLDSAVGSWRGKLVECGKGRPAKCAAN